MKCSITNAGRKVCLGVGLFACLFVFSAHAAPKVQDDGTNRRTTLTVIDTSLHDWEILRDGSDDSKVLVLRTDQDPLAQISAALTGMSNVQTVNIFAHGTAGQLHISNRTISTASLDPDQVQWRELGSHLAPGADLMLYGCDIAQGEEGRLFVDRLAQVTGADVAASSNATGEPRFGGDWDLEVRRGSIESASLRVPRYPGLLTIVTFTSGEANWVSNTITKTVGGKALTFSTGSYIGWESFSGPGAIYPYDGYMSGNYERLTISIASGNTFDISSLKVDAYTPTLNFVLTYANGSTGSFNVTPSFFSYSTLSFVSNPINDVKMVVITADDDAYFQDFDITDVKSTASAPTVTTSAATSISATGTNLNGIVNDNGASTAVSFNYGPTTGYGTTVAATTGGTVSAGAGSTAAAKTLTGLTCNSTYHFRASAVNTGGTTNGSDAGFTTSACVPGAPTIGTATPGVGQVSVTFTAPGSNGGATIAGYTVTSSPGSITGAGTTSPITVVGLTNGTNYTFSVKATNSAGTGTASAASNSVVPKANQTITFTNPGTQNFGTTPTLSASATSGLTPTFTSSTTGVCTVTSIGALTFVAPGTCTIVADQAGNASFNAASPVSPSFSVNAVVSGAPTIGTATAGDAQVSVSFVAPVSNGGATIMGYTVTSSPGSITATGATSPITITGLTNGTNYTFSATATNSAGTGAASAASNSATPKANQTITFTNPGPQNFGTTPVLSASATSGLTPTFTSSTTGVCTITTGGAMTFVVPGTCAIVANQTGNASFNAASPVSPSFSVNAVVPGAPTIGTTTAGDAQVLVSFIAPAFNGGATITAYTVTSSPGSITATGSVSPFTITGLTNGTNYTFSVTATNSAGTGAASAASNSVTPKANQTITFSNPGPQNFGTTPVLSSSATSGLTPTFTSSTTGVCTITTGGALAFVAVGTCTIRADQSGNASYNAASPVNPSFSVNAVVPGVPTIGTATADDAQVPVSFTAPAFNGGAAIAGYTVTSNPGSITGTGTTSPITVAGLTNGTNYTFSVTSTNSAGTGAASAPSNSVIPKGNQTITFSNPGSQSFGTTPTLSASATSGLPTTFTSSTTGVCTITTGGALVFIAVGTCTIRADQPGSASFNAASPVIPSFSIVAIAPGAATIGTATSGDAQASVSFSTPASSGGAMITGYTATSSPGGITSTGTTSPITVTGLTNGTAYTFAVTVITSAGTGAASTSSNSVTPKANQTITFSNPGPQNFGTTPTLSASTTSGLTPTLMSSTTGVCTVATGSVLTLVIPGMCTLIAAQAGNGSFNAASPVSQSFSVNAVVPGAPAIGTAAAGDTQASVTFSAPAFNGGAAITEYIVMSNPDCITATGSGSPIVITGLTNGKAYTFTVMATNPAGTGAASAASNSALFDVTAPAIADGNISLNTALFRDQDIVTVTWNNSVSGDNNGDIASVTANLSAFGGGASVVAVNNSGLWSASAAVNLPAGGVNLNASVTATDTNSNQTTKSDSTNAIVDNTAPGISVGAPDATSTGAGPVSYAITYGNADTVTLTASNVTLSATGTATGIVSVSGSGTAARGVTIRSITGDGTLKILIAAGTASDTAGNTALAQGPSSTFIVDNTAPRPAITSTISSPTNSGSIPISVTFGEAVNGFDVSHLVLTNGTVSGFHSNEVGIFVFDLSPLADGAVTVKIAAGAAHDDAGNNSQAGVDFIMFSLRTVPLPVISSTETSPTKADPIAIAVNFGVPVTGFDLSDALISGGTAGGFVDSGSGKFGFTITPAADGTVAVNIAAGVAQNGSGVVNAAAVPFTIASDKTILPPVVTGMVFETSTLSGTGEPGATVLVTGNSGTISACTAAVFPNGSWSCVPGSGVDLSQSLTVIQTDLAGNVSAPSTFTPDDGDGISSTEELSGPNQITDSNGNHGADANGDGLLDAFQSNVATLKDATSGTSVSIAIKGTNPATGLPSTCTNFNFVQSMVPGETLHQGGVVPPDPGFQYPFGLMNYAVKCAADSASNEVMTVDFYFYPDSKLTARGLRAEDFIVRKFAANSAGYLNPQDIGVSVNIQNDDVLANKAGVSQVIRMTLTLQDNGAGDDSPVHNILIDPIGIGLPAPGSVLLDMTANKHQLSVGDVVQYQIRATNNTNAALPDISINDQLPPGFKPVPGSLRLVAAGITTSLTEVGENRDLHFGPFTIPAESSVTVAFSALVGGSAQAGRRVNAATAATSQGAVSATATVSVDIVSDPILDRATVLGRVFNDRNGNGRLDDGEAGIPAARLITAAGEWIVADEFGRFNVPGIDAGPNARGQNFILKLDANSLQDGVVFTTENPRVERITEGSTTRIDFGVQLSPATLPNPGDGTTVHVGETGRLWVSNATTNRAPRLTIGAPEGIYLNSGGRPAPSSFWIDSDFPAFVDHWELSFYSADDDTFSNPLHTIAGRALPIGSPVIWNGDITSGKLEVNQPVRYRLMIVDAKGNIGWTVPRTIAVFSGSLPVASKPQVATAWSDRLRNQNDLSSLNFALPAGMVTVFGEGLPSGGIFSIDGAEYPIDLTGRVVFERRHSAGPYEISTWVRDASGNTVSESPLSGELKSSDFSLIGIADFTIGGNHLNGNVDALKGDDHFDENIFVDGRIAFYLKGRVSGRYLLTAQLDSGEDKLSNLLNNLNARDPRDLFKRIDPDRYYPVYGDNSTRGRDVDTQGKLYVRLEWDRSTLVWGNFNTGFTGAKLAEYNRGLYGAKVDIRSAQSTANGDETTVLKAFASQPDTAAAHDEFEGTGGSLYYLRHQDVVLGSMKLSVEVRELSSDRIRERTDLKEGTDYDIDEFQGRIILIHPLRMTVDRQLLSVIRDTPLDGDRVFLSADYEYISETSFDTNNVSAGLRARHWFGDHIGVGGTFIREDASPTDFQKTAGDVTLRARKNTYISMEYAQTDAAQAVDSGISSDGGLTFVQVAAPGFASRNGNAVSVDAKLDLSDYLGDRVSGKFGAWMRDQDAGFDALSFTSDGASRRNSGFEGTWKPTPALRLSGRYSDDQSDIGQLRTADIQSDYRFNGSFSLSTEYQHREGSTSPLPAESVFGASPGDLRGDIVGGKFRWTATERFSAFVSGQFAANLTAATSSSRSLFGVGGDYRVSRKILLTGEVFNGNRGTGGRGAVEYSYRQGSTAYVSYTTADAQGSGDGLILGQRSQLTDKLRIYQEHRFDVQSSDRQKSQSYGMAYSFAPGWTVGAEALSGKARQSGQWRDRNAYSVSSNWTNSRTKFSNKLEYRLDDSIDPGIAGRGRQWVTTNRFSTKLNDDISVVSKLDFSISSGAVAGIHSGRFGEFDFGVAYRPLRNNRLNMLSMYSYVDNLSPQQAYNSTSLQGSYFDDRFHVVSVDGMYALTSRWETGGKLAWKRTEDRTDRDTGAFFASDTKLAIVRARYRFEHKWSGLAEFRELAVTQAGNSRSGFLGSLGYEVTRNVEVSSGYNFTDFNDNLKTLNYNSRGWFMNLAFKY